MRYQDPAEFAKFYRLLTKNNPEYQPFFFPLNHDSKDPIEGVSWKKNRLTYEQALQWLEKGYNIGIAATDQDKLVIMDKDDLIKVGPTKPTLSTISRKRIGQHCFYFTEDKVSNNIFDDSAKQNIATEDYGEIRANWQYVVCAGSYVPVTSEELEKIPEQDKVNAGRYTVMDELQVSTITYSELPPVYVECLQEKRANEIKVKLDNANKKQHEQDKHDTVKSALYSLTIEDVTGKSDDISKRFASLFHGSDTGKNTSISKGLLHCWRHNVSHTPLTALAVIAGIGNCGSVGYGHNGSGTSGLDLDDGETVFKLWEYAKKEGLIPKDDPIPTKALTWYALKKQLCKNNDIIEGWKLPATAYNETIWELEASGTNPGRAPLKINRSNGNRASSGSVAWDMVSEIQETIPIHYDESGTFWLWTGRYYKTADEIEVLLEVLEANDPSIIKNDIKNQILTAAKLIGRRRRVLEPPVTWIHAQNGIIDIKTGTRIEPAPDYLLTAPIPHNIGSSKDTPTIDKLFTEWVGGDNKQLLYEICAYCLYGGYPIHRLFLLFGRGRNGKGQFRDLIVRLVGEKNRTATTIEQLINSRFESARLYKKRVVTIGETNFSLLEDTAIIKMLSGGDPIPGEFKNKNPFEFVNTAKLLINTNSVPPTTDKTDAFNSRWVFVIFPNQFQKGKDIIDTIPPGEYDNLLTKCIDILKDLLERGEFTGEGNIQDKAKQYEALSNPLSEFIEKHFIRDINGKIPVFWIYENFPVWLMEKGLRVYSVKETHKLIDGMGFEFEKDQRFDELSTDPNKKFVAVRGLRFKNNPFVSGKTNADELKTDVPKGNNSNVGGTACESEKKTAMLSGMSDESGISSLSGSHKETSGKSSDIPDMSDSTAVSQNNSQKTPVTELTAQLEAYGRYYQGRYGVINDSNLTGLCMDFVKLNNPKMPNGDPYTPSMIRPIAAKIYRITPGVDT